MFIIKVKTALSLGVVNFLRFFAYKIGVSTGLNPVRKITSQPELGGFFLAYDGHLQNLKVNDQWLGAHTFFGKKNNALGVPNWQLNCLTHGTVSYENKPWFLISDFDKNIGDIKGIWEASRFDWVLCYAQSIARGNKADLNSLNLWLNDWLSENPPYLGVNWKCGQEASIRVMHLAMAAKVLGQSQRSSTVLIALIKAHLKRIFPTIMYAIAQDNNHGTSEAAALFIGGSWLSTHGDVDGLKWESQGRHWLENRAERLIERDGSFSQYSMTYHRVMLDTFCMAEVWRKELGLPAFSQHLYTKLKAATLWLFQMTQRATGEAPNLGANDGARLLPLTGTDYRDFRPCVQLSACVFLGKAAYLEMGDWDLPLQWLGYSKPGIEIETANSVELEGGGYALLRKKHAFVMFNYPHFKFRPSQCDALHVDFWYRGENILRDGGTYSYNAGQKFIDYYAGVESHNTVQFDAHQQMPRLSRFLLGDWLKTKEKSGLVENEACCRFSASYQDRFGCIHARTVSLSENILQVIDTVSGFKRSAILRWRLQPGEWQVKGNSLINPKFRIDVSADVPIVRLALVRGFESKYYYQESELPVLEVEIEQAGDITTEIFF
ncbi:heparinase II/III-family protein [Neptunomonas sp.]|uniref:heparinase II/III family protein n=1 Tax=Neptunomonas sp. TaxID=1971898 RepID=UPI0035664CFE